MSLVWDKFPRAGTELLCILKFSDYSNDDGLNIYPSMPTIARQLRVSESQARRVVHKLIDEGWIKVVGNKYGGAPGSSRRYQININKLNDTPSVSATPSVEARASADVRDGAHVCAEGLAPMQVNPSLITNKHQLVDVSSSKEMDLFELFWNGYRRKENKKKAKSEFNRLSIDKQKQAIDDSSTRYANTDRKYIPLPTTYLNGERWNDEKIDDENYNDIYIV